MFKYIDYKKCLCTGLIIAFLGSYIPQVKAEGLVLPVPGTMVALTPSFTPAYLQGIKINPKDPFKFDFLVHQSQADLSQEQKQDEYTRLVKYFLASLTTPEQNQWVNLSPYEKNRIIEDDFGKTEMGRDLLAQDYILKQLTSSLMYPESGLGKKFWDDVYRQAQEKFGSVNIPVNTFNKVWIVPDEAVVYESNGTAYILKSHLNVMLEEDYLAAKRAGPVTELSILSSRHPSPRGVAKENSNDPLPLRAKQTNSVPPAAMTSETIRQLLLPILEREVNEGKNFAQLRQIVSAMILATWFKKSLKESILAKVYADKAKIKGTEYRSIMSSPNLPAGRQVLVGDLVHSNELDARQRLSGMTGVNDVQLIYQQYLQSFKKGAFNYIKETASPNGTSTPRKYFAGGFQLDSAMIKTTNQLIPSDINLNGVDQATVSLAPGVEMSSQERAQKTLDAVGKNVVDNMILHQWYVDYNKELRRLVNPQGGDFHVAVGFPGTDVTNLWLATGFTKAYWVYSTEPYEMMPSKFRSALENFENVRFNQGYFREKFLAGWNNGREAEKETAHKIIAELKAMGASDVRVQESNNGSVYLFFKLPFDIQERSIEFINESILEPSEALNRKLLGQVDAYYEKASYYFVQTYVRRFGIYNHWLKPGGKFVLNRIVVDDHEISFSDIFPGHHDLAENDSILQGLVREPRRDINYSRDSGYGWHMAVLVPAVDRAMASSESQGDSLSAEQRLGNLIKDYSEAYMRSNNLELQEYVKGIGFSRVTYHHVIHGRNLLRPEHMKTLLGVLKLENEAEEQLWKLRIQAEVDRGYIAQTGPGHDLAARRIRVGLSRKEIARKLNIDRRNIFIYEKGQSRPTQRYLELLSSLEKLPGDANSAMVHSSEDKLQLAAMLKGHVSDYIKKKGITVEKFAKDMGISKQEYYRFIKAEVLPKPDLMNRLLRAWQLNPQDEDILREQYLKLEVSNGIIAPDGLGYDLARKRIRMGLSRKEVADRLGAIYMSVRNYELNITHPKPEFLSEFNLMYEEFIIQEAQGQAPASDAAMSTSNGGYVIIDSAEELAKVSLGALVSVTFKDPGLLLEPRTVRGEIVGVVRKLGKTIQIRVEDEAFVYIVPVGQIMYKPVPDKAMRSSLGRLFMNAIMSAYYQGVLEYSGEGIRQYIRLSKYLKRNNRLTYLTMHWMVKHVDDRLYALINGDYQNLLAEAAAPMSFMTEQDAMFYRNLNVVLEAIDVRREWASRKVDITPNEAFLRTGDARFWPKAMFNLDNEGLKARNSMIWLVDHVNWSLYGAMIEEVMRLETGHEQESLKPNEEQRRKNLQIVIRAINHVFGISDMLEDIISEREIPPFVFSQPRRSLALEALAATDDPRFTMDRAMRAVNSYNLKLADEGKKRADAFAQWIDDNYPPERKVESLGVVLKEYKDAGGGIGNPAGYKIMREKLSKRIKNKQDLVKEAFRVWYVQQYPRGTVLMAPSIIAEFKKDQPQWEPEKILPVFVDSVVRDQREFLNGITDQALKEKIVRWFKEKYPKGTRKDSVSLAAEFNHQFNFPVSISSVLLGTALREAMLNYGNTYVPEEGKQVIVSSPLEGKFKEILANLNGKRISDPIAWLNHHLNFPKNAALLKRYEIPALVQLMKKYQVKVDDNLIRKAYSDLDFTAVEAVSGTKPEIKSPGGIDLNGANLNLIIKRDGHGVALPSDKQDLAQLGRIEGLIPTVLSILPANASFFATALLPTTSK